MENGHCDLTGHGTGGLGANEPCSAFEIPSEMVFLPKNAVFPVSKGIFPFWSKIFLRRKIFDQKGKIPFETGKTAFFGRKTISDGISKAEQGSFAPKPPVPWPVRSQCPFSILPRV